METKSFFFNLKLSKNVPANSFWFVWKPMLLFLLLFIIIQGIYIALYLNWL